MTGARGDEFAFPYHLLDVPLADARNPKYLGLTKRELFAAMAMQGLVLRLQVETNSVLLAQAAVIQADALLAELAKT